MVNICIFLYRFPATMPFPGSTRTPEKECKPSSSTSCNCILCFRWRSEGPDWSCTLGRPKCTKGCCVLRRSWNQARRRLPWVTWESHNCLDLRCDYIFILTGSNCLRWSLRSWPAEEFGYSRNHGWGQSIVCDYVVPRKLSWCVSVNTHLSLF